MHKRMKALVTGGAGFIGTHLCEELTSRGFELTVVDNFSSAPLSNVHILSQLKGLKVYRNTILNQRLMAKLVQRCDIVFHLAAAVGVKFILNHELESLLTNVKGTEVMLEAANRYRKKIVLASTSEIYGKHYCAPIRENDDRVLGSTSVSRWSYSDAKAVDECLALAYAKEKSLPIVIVRLFNTVGPRQIGRYGMVLPRFIEEALSGRPITVYGDGTHVRSFAYVKDVTRAMADLALDARAEGEIFNVGNNQPIAIKDLALKVKEKTNSASEIVFIPFDKAFGNKAHDFEDIECRIPDISKLCNLLQFKPQYDIDMIVESTVDYFAHKHKEKK